MCFYISADPRLPNKFRAAIQDPGNDVYLSVVSIWEAVIKHGLGKLPLPGPPAEFLPAQRVAHAIASLNVDEGAWPQLAALPPLHRDPFDRLLLAQSLQYGLTVLTVDPAVAAYPVPQMSTK